MDLGVYRIKDAGCHVNRLNALRPARYDAESASARWRPMSRLKVRTILAALIPVFLMAACSSVSVMPYGIEVINTSTANPPLTPPLIYVYSLDGGFQSIDTTSTLGKEILSYVGSTPSSIAPAGVAVDNTTMAILSGLQAILPSPVLTCTTLG